jgi:hypothetical protein
MGRLEVLPVQDEDLRAASVLLIRSFATSPDSVTVSLKSVECAA